MEECRDYIILSRDLGYMDKQRFIELKELSEYVSRMINSYCSGIVKNSALKDNEI